MTSNQAPVFFWRETEAQYGFLSQWYDSTFQVDGVEYRTAEMWMMVQKARLFGDEDIAQKMMQTTNPKEHQALGRKAKGFDRKKWDEHKSRIVEEGNYHKFTKTTPEMKMWLLETGDRELVEASPYDRIWGVGFVAKDAELNRSNWGENRLGKAIMKVREQLRNEEKI
ncbi:Hypothetical protein R9X50_00218300 [Acrodontium crateriforme]|uniref:NADAR domain-containing protein n=1 Tax=Acrodontium crateriforme TaxID=150365 RepID=A0AAQ3R8S2_9PEZI|nr:Hypothetical protein R9X50_00218300 [Acrodontium crateriforme]